MFFLAWNALNFNVETPSRGLRSFDAVESEVKKKKEQIGFCNI